MASKTAFEDLDLSREELKRIETALKDEKFRKMFVEYAEEISNPENRKRYEEEIAMLEKEKGMDVQFVNPEPGHVLKTTVDGKKSFINICTSDKMGKPSSERREVSGQRGLHWQIPHSFSPPREDLDKNKGKCMVYDVVFHPDTYTMSRNPKFLKLVEDTALEGIERQFAVKVDKNNIRRPKLKYKGQPVATIIRNKSGDSNKENKPTDKNDPLANMPYPYGDKTSSELAEAKAKEAEKRAKDKANKESKTKSNIEKKEVNGYTTPNYTMTHRSNMDIQEYRNAPDARPTTRPKELVVSIELPLCKSAAGVDLDIFEEKLTLKCEKPAYQLNLKLPFAVDDENGSAKFDKSKKSLIVTMPVIPGEVPKMPSFHDDKESTINGDVAPLIEELPPLEEVVDNATADEDLPPLEEIHEKCNDETAETPKKPPPVSYTLPQYDYNQDNETVTFVFHVRNIKDDTVCKSFPAPGESEIKFVSLGSGGFPMHYSFYTSFGEDSKLVPEYCTIDVSEKNMTFTLLKAKGNRTLWNKFEAGLDRQSLEEKLFLTTDTLQAELDQLQTEGEAMGRTDDQMTAAGSPEIRVTQMNEKKLTLKIRKAKVSFSEEEEGNLSDDECPSSASIEVIHSKSTPPLHGILKQRSMSESSMDDPSSSGESPTSTSPRDSDGGRRSVSFNNHIDKTTFKTNSSVSSMKQALKSKRRRNRKKEEKVAARTSRRRHNSNGSECSSCDEHDPRHSSESMSEEDLEHEPLTEQLEQTSKKVEDCGIIPEDEEQELKETEVIENSVENVNKQPGYQIQSQNKQPENKASKLVSEVKSKLAEKKSETAEADSDDDNDGNDDNEEDGERTTSAVSEDNVMTRDENQQKVVDKTSGDNVEKSVEMSGNDLNGVNTNGRQVDSGETTEKGDNRSAIKGDNSKKGSSKKGVRFKEGEESGKNVSVNGQNESVNGQNESVNGKGGNSGEKQVEGKGEVETELKWNDQNHDSPYNPHRTQCAFDFSNAVMFDLDID